MPSPEAAGPQTSVLRQEENSQLELNVCKVESEDPSHCDPSGHLRVPLTPAEGSAPMCHTQGRGREHSKHNPVTTDAVQYLEGRT